MNDDEYTLESGLLAVGDGHKIYYQRWGNVNADPIVALHGGPGSCSKDKHKNLFDPAIHHVVFFDQRGCGQSEAKSPLEANTTQTLTEDMELIREHLHIQQWHVFGYSWGVALGLYYATKFPDKVNLLLFGGVYLGSKAENEHLFNGGLRQYAPEAWEWYTQPIPIERQKDCLGFYAEKLLGDETTDDEKLRLLTHYTVMESSLVSRDSDFISTKIDALRPKIEDLRAHQIGLTYFAKDCFIPTTYFEKELPKLKNKKCIIVQGAMDFVCPPATAFKLSKQLGDNAHLHIVPTSHAREGAMRETIRAYLWALFD